MLRTCVLLALVVGCSKDEPARPVGEDLDRRLTEGECEAAVAHAIQLLEAEPSARAFAEQMKLDPEARVAECLDTGRLRDHRCLMTARTFDELGRCPMPGGSR